MKNPGPVFMLVPMLVTAIFCTLFLTAFGGNKRLQASEPTIEIQVSNPYKWDVDIELQCDWDNTKHTYKTHQYLLFAGQSIQTIVVPGNTKSCKIWPHVRLWD